MTNPEIKKFAYRVLRHSQGSLTTESFSGEEEVDGKMVPITVVKEVTKATLKKEFAELTKKYSLDGITKRVHGWLSMYFDLATWENYQTEES